MYSMLTRPIFDNDSRDTILTHTLSPDALFELPLPLCMSKLMSGPAALRISHKSTLLSWLPLARVKSLWGDQARDITGRLWDRRMCVDEPEWMSHSVISHSLPPTVLGERKWKHMCQVVFIVITYIVKCVRYHDRLRFQYSKVSTATPDVYMNIVVLRCIYTSLLPKICTYIIFKSIYYFVQSLKSTW